MSAFTLEQKIDFIFNWVQQYGENHIQSLQAIAIKDKAKDNWLNENHAAALLNVKPRTLRDKVKADDGWDINYRNENGKKWEYYVPDIMKHKQETSTLI